MRAKVRGVEMNKYRIVEFPSGFYVERFVQPSKILWFKRKPYWRTIQWWGYFGMASDPIDMSFDSVEEARKWISEREAKDKKFSDGCIVHEARENLHIARGEIWKESQVEKL
jgi:hypothetical protein